VCASHSPFFLAQLLAAKQQLKAVQDREVAARDPNKEPIRVERPDKIKNLQAAMGLMNDDAAYGGFTVSFFLIVECVPTEQYVIV
jgi:hypothetical protein